MVHQLKKLPLSFYTRDNVVEISKDLIGKELCTNINGKITSGIIVETEAYAGITDKASHAYNNRRTKRTETMFLEGGKTYVYLCYGIHHLFNVVTNIENIPHAVLIRAINPNRGLPYMLSRRKREKQDSKLCSGPGTLSQALSITTSHNGLSLQSDTIWIEEGQKISPKSIVASKRIGIDYAEEDVHRLYRFNLVV